ncbi:hypothetical protein [Marinobacterium marinum]|uniref:Uncharacterized protein n=1 Tax=Marinobacterium marinum TaxID=2756129 RepID=A0A7W2AC18_9GAMM|nr:hypothetical protein [Marinobacterium marinum]MBA4502665.1 hypothetical protein [Marinobacterium marinum]
MSLIWNETVETNPFMALSSDEDGCTFHATESSSADDEALKQDVEACLDKAVSLLNANVRNESLYFFVEWHPAQSVLKMLVTGTDKVCQAQTIPVCRFAAVDAERAAQVEFVELMKFWIKDYLSLVPGFMDFSLVAMFTDTDRDRARLV